MTRTKWVSLAMLATIVVVATGCPGLIGGPQPPRFHDLVATGAHHSCAQWVVNDQDATILKCWGDNGSGQLGDGTITSSNAPVTVLVG